MEVGVAHDRRLLHISVRDHAAGLPRLGGAQRPVERVLATAAVAPGPTTAPAAHSVPEPSAEQLREDGRGLLVVSALTHAWGCTPVPDGKVVWATLRI
jgi:hypothetical protein